MSLEHGRILEVRLTRFGSELTGDHATGVSTLLIEDCCDFDDVVGGILVVGGVQYAYFSVDDEAGTIALGSPLVADASDGDRVDIWDPLYGDMTTEKVAEVKVDGDEDDADPVEATIALHLSDKLVEGIRGGLGESVLLELDGDTWRVVDLLGLEFLSPMPDPDEGGETKFWNDSTTVITAGGDQEITLTFLPISQSEHVYWNGIYQAAPEWTRAGQVITLPDPDGVFEADDRITVEYAYLDGAVIVTPDAPDAGIEYPAATLHTPYADTPIWVATSDGWGDWQQTCHFVLDIVAGSQWRAYVVFKKFDTGSVYYRDFVLTTYGGTDYQWDKTNSIVGPAGAGLHTMMVDLTMHVSEGRHTPIVPQGDPVYKFVGAGIFPTSGAGVPTIFEDVPQDYPTDPTVAVLGVTDPALQCAYWGVKVANLAGTTTDEPYGALPGGS